MTHARHDADQFVARYAPNLSRGTVRLAEPPLVPTLTHSLAALGRLPGMAAALDRLGANRRCLLQGCTAPGNAVALRRFLGETGGGQVDITAVDLLDLPAIYARLGWPMPDMRFVRADARDLSARFPPDSFDLVVQDFLLNCAPPSHAPALLTAARHVLPRGGLLLLSVTDSTGLRDKPNLSAAEFERHHHVPWDPTARDLATLLPEQVRRAAALPALAGRAVMGPGDQQGTLITAPHGRFEFFVPIAETMAQLAQAGFEVLGRGQEQGRDDNDLHCTRWRCLACAV
jgi:SAM-dependent methyltransferase